jgi:hypothetical protein
MPSSRSKVVRKQPSTFTGSPAKRQRRKPPASYVLPTLSLLISDGTTTEADLCRWADLFARFHTDPLGQYVPVALRTIDCVVTVGKQEARCLRCVREVAKFNGARGVEWMLITWVPGLPGMRFENCAALDDAMSLLDASPAPIFF